jgi:hypothetical protein
MSNVHLLLVMLDLTVSKHSLVVQGLRRGYARQRDERSVHNIVCKLIANKSTPVVNGGGRKR